MKNQKLNRRRWLQLGLGLAAGSTTGFVPVDQINPDDCSLTPSMELGPFPPMKSRTQPDHDLDLTKVQGQTGVATGEMIEVMGKILDDKCLPVEGAIVELWQANHYGKYNHEYDIQGQHDPNFQGWGQVVTKRDGHYRFKTVVPGLYAQRTRHIHFKISKRGYHELVTQLYFEGEQRNNTDGIYNNLTDEEQKDVTRSIDRSGDLPRMEFDVHIKKLKEGTVSSRVLQMYIGNYRFNYKGSSIEGLIDRLYPKQEEVITAAVTHEGEQLYLQLPFTPKMELYWKAKDHFDGSEFFQMELKFKRGEDGKVNGMSMRWDQEREIIANRV
jgi:protocatechuate 3,4-dioxygenase beta subunit